MYNQQPNKPPQKGNAHHMPQIHSMTRKFQKLLAFWSTFASNNRVSQVSFLTLSLQLWKKHTTWHFFLSSFCLSTWGFSHQPFFFLKKSWYWYNRSKSHALYCQKIRYTKKFKFGWNWPKWHILFSQNSYYDKYLKRFLLLTKLEYTLVSVYSRLLLLLDVSNSKDRQNILHTMSNNYYHFTVLKNS